MDVHGALGLYPINHRDAPLAVRCRRGDVMDMDN